MIAALLLACSVQGAGDPFPDDPALSPAEIDDCLDGNFAEPPKTAVDPTARGKLVGPPPRIVDADITSVVALDFSGSMYGGYEQGNKPSETCPFYWEIPAFDAMLQNGPLSAIPAGAEVHTAVFGKRVHWLGSPSELPAKDFADLPDAPWKAEFAKKGRLWDESRMEGVLDESAKLFAETERGDGVLWIVTDNIVDIGDGPEAAYNRNFYEKLKQDARWQVAYAYPVHQGEWLCGSTLLVYALYFSENERITPDHYEDLQGLLSPPGTVAAFAKVASPESPSPGHPFKLKPDDIDLISPSFDGTVDCGGPRATGLTRTCVARVGLDNLLMHRRITGATLHFSSARLDAWDLNTGERVPTAVPFPTKGITAHAELTEPIEPNEDVVLEVELEVPAVETEHHTIRDHWESAQHPQFDMVGPITVRITGLWTEMAIDADSLGDVYGVESLPELFSAPTHDEMQQQVCLTLAVDNPSYFSSILMLALFGGGGLLFIVGSVLLKPSYRWLYVDGMQKEQLRVSRLLSTRVEVDGKHVAKLKQALGGTIKLVAVKPWRLMPKGGKWELENRGDEFGGRRTLELKRRGSSPSARAKNDF